MPYTCRNQTVHFKDEANGVHQDFLAIQKELSKEKKLFEDDQFPAEMSSLYYSKEPKYTFEWKRPGDIVKNPRLIVDGTSRFDIKQGVLRDCWILAGMANLAIHENLRTFIIPKNQSFEDNYAGVFHFRFWRHGEWVDVVIDDRLPTVDGNLAFVKSTTGQEFWSALLEKAYAKLFGSYEAIESGESIESMVDFSGGVPEVYVLKKQNPKKLFKILHEAYSQHAWLTCSIQKVPNPERAREMKEKYGLIMGHAYTLTAVRKVKFQDKPLKQKLVRIRNPWGNETEWKGAYCDKSAEWINITSEEMKECKLNFKNDGEFWMHLSDFIKHFTTVEICNLSQDIFHLAPNEFSRNYTVSVHNGSWNIKKATAGGNLNHKMTFKWNPQYRVTLKELDIQCCNVGGEEYSDSDSDSDSESDEDDKRHMKKGKPKEGYCTLIVALMQKNRRKGRQDGQSPHNIGCYVYLIPDSEKWSKQKLPNMFFGKHEPIYTPIFKGKYREVSARLHLKPGTYLIVPCTDFPFLEADYMLRLLTEKPVDCHCI